MPPWTQVFAPQPDAFNLLDQAWRDAKSGAPQLVVLTGETGWGKTRTVQEWYAHLVQSEQAKYWPPKIGNDIADRRNQVVPSIQDFTAESSAPMPFLYLGARADLQLAGHAADGDNRRYGSREPLIDLKTQLGQHFFGIWAGKHGQQLNREMLVELAKQSFDNTPDLLSLLGDAVTTLPGFELLGLFKLRQWGELVGKFRTYQQNVAKVERELETSPAARAQRQDMSLVQDLHLQLREVLRGDVEGVQAMPVVLFIDDAHAASPDTLRFLQTLVGEAIREKWPLLVIFTHWEREWQQDQAAFRPGDELTQAAHLPLCFDGKEGRADLPCHVYDLTEATPDFNAMLAEALPTLTEADRAMMVRQSGGHALFLVHLVRAIERDRMLFVGPEGLTDLGRRKVQQFTDFTDLARDRFDGLEDHVRQVLGWGSLAGMRFLHRLTRRLATDSALPPVLSPELHDTGVQAARAGAFVDPLDYEASEFDQVTFYRLAQRYVGDLAEAESLRWALKRALQAEMATDDWRALPMAEQMDLLDIVTRELRPTDPDPNSIEDARWAAHVIALGLILVRTNRWYAARQVLKDMVQLSPDKGWNLEGISITHIASAASLLASELYAPHSARRLLKAYFGAVPEFDREPLAWSQILRILSTVEDGETSLANARLALRISKDFARKNPQSTEGLESVVSSLLVCGDLMTKSGRFLRAASLYEVAYRQVNQWATDDADSNILKRLRLVVTTRLASGIARIDSAHGRIPILFKQAMSAGRALLDGSATRSNWVDYAIGLKKFINYSLRQSAVDEIIIDEAIRLYLMVSSTLVGERNVRFLDEVIDLLHVLVRVSYQRDFHCETRSYLRQVLALSMRRFSVMDPVPEDYLYYASALRFAHALRLYPEVEQGVFIDFVGESRSICSRILSANPHSIEAIEGLALTEAASENFVKAYRLMRRRNRRFDPSIQSRQWEDQLKADLAERNIPLPPDEAETS